MYLAADDPDSPARVAAFAQGLQELGWIDGRNVRIDYRWGAGNTDRYRAYAAELVALAPDVILVSSGSALAAVQNATRTVPIVFVNVGDPVGAGFVASLAQPGGNATGNPTTAPTIAQRLIAQNELTAILGAYASSLTLAISEVTARADVPFLTQAYADEITGRGLESVFKVTATASVIGRAQVNYTLAIAEAARKKIEKIAIMYEDTAYGIAQSRGVRRAAKDANIEVVMDEPYPLGINDATPLIDKLRACGAQAAFPLSYLNDSLFIVRTMRRGTSVFR